MSQATILSCFESNLSCMNSTYGRRLEHALELAGKDRLQLADAINVSVQAIGQVIIGKTKALTAENSARAARFLKVDGFWLATGEGDAQGSRKSIADEVGTDLIDLEALASLSPNHQKMVADTMATLIHGFLATQKAMPTRPRNPAIDLSWQEEDDENPAQEGGDLKNGTEGTGHGKRRPS